MDMNARDIGSEQSTPWIILGALILAFMCLWNFSALSIVFSQGELFGPDDFLRMSQIRAWMNGQNWFDMTAYQMVPPSGGDVHWSRIVDVPVAGMMWVFGLFLDQRLAENLASIVWPFALMAATLLVWVEICKRLLPYASPYLVLVFGLFSIPALSQFTAGRLDHHNLQILLFSIMCLGLISRERKLSDWLIGFSLAVSIAIGIDTLIIMLVVLAIVSCEWAFGADTSGRGMQRVGLALGLTSILLFVIFVPPSVYSYPACDANSSFFLTSFVMLGAGFFALGLLGRKIVDTSLMQRSLKRIGLGLMVAIPILGILVFAFSQCLAGPVAGLDSQLVTRWLSQVEEARPLWSVLEKYPHHWLASVGYLVMINCVGLYVIMRTTHNRAAWISLFVLMLACSLAAILQIRLLRTGIFVTIPFAVALAHFTWTALKRRYENEQFLAIVFQGGVIASMVSVTWFVAGAVVFSPKAVATPQISINYENERARRFAGRCQQYDDYKLARSLDRGVFVSDLTNSMALMVHSNHTVISGPYHRNGEAILAVLDFMRTDEASARKVAGEYSIDYAGFCIPQLIKDREDYPEGSIGNAMLKGELPSWLQSVSNEGQSPSDRFVIYRIN